MIGEPQVDADALEATARNWVLLSDQGGLEPEAQAQLAEWLAAHADHRRAFERAGQAWKDIGELQGRPEFRAMMDISRRSRLPRFAAAASVLWMAGAAFWVLHRSPTAPAQRFSTQVAQIRTITLSDGSVLTMGGSTQLSAQLGAIERRVKVSAGEAYFSVRKDPVRPFVVDFGGASVKVIGTTFEMRGVTEGVRIAVAAGSVQVAGSATAEPTLLTAGESVTVTQAGRLMAQEMVATDTMGSWRSGHLSYDDAPLAEVIADANRYYPAGIRLASPELGALRVNTTFNIAQVEMMIDSLPQALPLTVEYLPDGSMVLRAKAR